MNNILDYYIPSFAGLLACSQMHPEGSATGHLDTGFLGFPLSKQMLRWFPSSEMLLHTSHTILLI
jgi:hypothetical protein